MPKSMSAPQSWSVEKLAPFAGGRGGMRMGLKALKPEDWLDLGPVRAERMAAKQPLLDESTLADAASLPAQAELCQLLAEHLANHGFQFESGSLFSEQPIMAAAAHTVEDLCILENRGDGYCLTAASVAFPTDWHLTEKIGRGLDVIHAPIEGYAQKLSAGVNHFFHTLPVGPIYTRRNGFITDTGALRWLVDRPAEERYAGLTGTNAGERLWVRSERQTLRRLPETKAIVFTIGVYVTRLDALPASQVADMAGYFASLPWEEAVRRNAHHYIPAVLEYSAQLAALSIGSSFSPI